MLLIAKYYRVSLDELVASDSNKLGTAKKEGMDSDLQIRYHLKSKHIPLEAVLELSKADFDFLSNYKKLTDENKAELQYLMNYKLRKQAD